MYTYMLSCDKCVENYGAGVKKYGARRYVRDGSVYNTYTISLVHILYIVHLHWYTWYKY